MTAISKEIPQSIGEQILFKLNDLSRRVSNMERIARRQDQEETWLTEEKVIEDYGYSKKTLQAMRRDGSLKSCDWRTSKTGRKPQYKKSALEGLFNS